MGDVVALLVELTGEGVQLAEELADLAGPAGQDLVDLVLQDLEVRNPPPRSTIARLANVCSVLGYAEEFFSGMVSPLRSSCGDGSAGAANSMC